MSDALTALRRRRNARLAIARIPPEILSDIFLFFRDTSILPTSVHWDNVPWISVTHVSVYWRSVALADPRLWNVVNLRFPDLVCHFSNYFAQIPLHIVLSERRATTWGQDASLEYGLDYILDHPLVAIEICTSEQEATSILVKVIPLAADTLVSLVVDMGNSAILLTSLEDTLIPNLHSFSISSVTIRAGCSLHSSCAGSLRELKLGGSFGDYKWHGKDFEVFTGLERLWLSDDTAVFSKDEMINLPSLSELHITDDADTSHTAIQAFCLPAGCHVRVTYELPDHPTSGQRLQEIITFLSAAHPNCARVYIAEGVIELRYEGAHGTHYSLKLTYDTKCPSAVETLAAILPSSTTELSVVCDIEPALYTLEKITACQSIQSLSVCGPFLIDSLLNSGRSEAATLLPTLSLVRVCNCNAAAERTLLHAWKFREG